MTTERSEPRSDHGRDTYVGDQSDQGSRMENSRVGVHDRRQQLEQLNEGKGHGKGLLLLGGAGVSAALIYLLRPAKRKSEQALEHDELLRAQCRDLMTVDPSCCLPSDAVNKAAELMKRENVGAIPVVDDHKTRQLIGIVTDRDLALNVIAAGRNAQNTSVADVMTRNVTACHASDDLEKALTEMSEQQLRRIPVVDDNRRIVGIIAQADVATRLDAPKKTAEVVEEISKAAASGRS